MANPYDSITRTVGQRTEEARRRRQEEAAQRQVDLGPAPQRTAESQRVSRQTQQPVPPADVPQALRQDEVRRIAETAGQYAGFARVFADPRLAATMTADADEQRRVARALDYLPRAAAAVAGVPAAPARYRFDGMSAAQIAATLNREEDAAVERAATGGQQDRRSTLLGRFLYTDLRTQLARVTGIDLREDVVLARARDDARRSDGALDDVGDYLGRAVTGVQSSLDSFGAAYLASEAEGDASRDLVGRFLIGDPARRGREMGLRAEAANAASRTGQERDAASPDSLSGFASVEGLKFVGQQALLSSPSLVASFFGRYGLAFNTASNSGNIAQTRAENEGRTISEVTPGDVQAALPYAVASASLDRFSAGRIARPLSAGTVGSRLMSAGGRVLEAGAVEASTESLQSVIEYTGGVVGTPEPWRVEEAQRAARDGAIVGFAMGGGVRLGAEIATGGGPQATFSRVEAPEYQTARRAAGEITRVADSEAMAETVNTIMDSSAKHTSRTSDPELFREALQAQVEGSPIENVYIPVEALDAYLQSEGAVDPVGLFNSIAEQVAEARLTGGDVVIPISDFAMAAAGTPAWEALKPDIRPAASALSPREVAASMEAIMADLEAKGADLVNPGEQGQTLTQDAQPGSAPLTTSEGETQTLEQATPAADPTVAVYDQVKAQLLGIKYKADDARKVAALVATHRAHIGSMLGMTAEEYHAANPIDFAREVAPAADGSTVLDQARGAQEEYVEPSATPLTGLPTVVKVDGTPREFGPYQAARDAAARVADRLGRDHRLPTDYVRVDVERASRIAQAYADMKHAPQNPEVKAAYEAMIAETMAQWAEIKASGLQVEFNQPGVDPYGNPRNAILDVVENNHLWVFPTDDGFGSSEFDPVDNPLLAIVDGDMWSGKPVRVNDVFRVVHDYFGHIMEGVGFRADGEENAWRIHSAMYSPLARKALTSETRGQNSWVNYGPNGEANRTASGGDTVYADQKIGLLPDWVVNEGAVDPAPAGNSVVAKTVYHGTAGLFSQFRDTGQPIWFAEDQRLANQYADPRRVRARSGGRVYAMSLDIRNPIDLTGAPSSTEDPKGWVASLGLPPSAFTLDNGSILTYRIFTRPEFVDALRAAGYDGIKIDEGGSTTWGALSPDQMRAAEGANPNGEPYAANTYYQSPDDIFYSALERAVEKGQKRATADQWLATLRNTPGVKADELAWTGVEEWLADKEGAVPQDELLAFVQGRGVQVEEVVNAGVNPEDFAGYPQRDEYEDDEEYEYAIEYFAENEGFDVDGDVQFKDWTTDPDNDTYRELLITLPLGERGNPERAAGTHWDQQGVVAHVRFMDKVDVEGKRVLFVEEVQSDWHQKGRDEGYATPASAERIAELLAAADGALAAREAAHKEYSDFLKTEEANVDKENALYEERQRTQLAYREAQQEYLNAAEARGIPDAPFKKSWPALAMKRVIRWAVENGYERVAWTTGAQQAERYNLSQSVGLLSAAREQDGRMKVIVANSSARSALAQNGLGESAGDALLMTDAQAQEAFGGDIASKLAERADAANGNYGAPLDGSDLNVGGEGMKAFYDRNLVNITNDIIKKFGARVGKLAIADMSPKAYDPALTAEAESAEMAWREAVAGTGAASQYVTEPFEDFMRVVALDLSSNEAQLSGMRDPEGPTYKRYEATVAWGKSMLASPEKARGFYDTAKALNEARSTSRRAYIASETAQPTQPGFDVTPKMREAALGGFPLFQTKPQGARGQVEFTRDGRAIITLFDRADASTIIHELGHVFFEEMRRNVQLPNAPASLKRDWGVLKQWLGANGAPVIDDVITREGHELIARGFERYALEGNAPHAALAKVFTTFRKWLQAIYSTVDALRAPINDDVRSVFDRWFATEEAIAAHTEEQAKPLLETKPDTMTAAEFEAYRSSVIAARNDAVNRLLEKTMRSIRAQRLDEFRSQRNEIRGVVAEEVNAEPRFRALDALRGTEKLNRNWLVTRFGEDAVNRLPKGPILVSNSGGDPELIAEMAGFASGEEMAEALFDLARETELLRASGDKRSVRDKTIADRVNEELEGIGAADPLRDDAIEAEALGAIHGEQQGEVFSAELRALGRLTGATVTPYKAARAWAKRRIREGRVHEVASRSAIQRYARAAAKEGRLAEEAYAKGEHAVAYRHKQAQLINHALVAEARVAATEVERISKRLSRLSRRAKQKSIDADYFERVQQLLALYEFKPVSQKMLDEAEGFADWAAKQAEAGYEVIAPARLLLGRDHYSRITVGALSDLNDAVASLMALGRLKQRLLDGQEQREFDEVVGDIVARVATLPQRKLKAERNEKDRLLASAAAALLKTETIAEELDGGTQGPMNRLLVERASDAENLRARLRDMVLMPVAAAYNGMSRKQKRRLAEKVTLPELPHRGGELDPRNGQPTVMTRMELLAVALNTGNMSNLDKLSRGEGWSIANIDKVLRRELTREDWAFVSAIWRSLDPLWPYIAAAEREMSGVVPERVEARDVTTPFGVIKGGYYPVVFDPLRSQMGDDNADAAAEDLFGMKAGVGTPKGHTISRTGAAAPMMLSVEGVLFNHVEKVITRSAFAVYARDVMRVTKNKRVREAIDVRLGREYRGQIKTWLQRVINSGALDTRGLKWWENLLRQSRVNLTMVAMGFRVSTMIAQISGLSSSIGRIGPLGIARGMRTMIRNPVAAQRFVFSRSEEMARRSSEMDRDVAELYRSLQSKPSVLDWARRAAFWHIAMMDRYGVSMPTWLGAYENGIAAGMTDQQASREGDKAVRMSQGSGRVKDLSNFQDPNSQAMRLMTQFYSYFNVFFNAQWQATRDVKRGRYGKAFVATFFFGMLAPMADAIMSGDLPEGEDDEGNEESWFEWALENIFYHQFSGIPFLRDGANYAERSFNDEYATLSTTPIVRIEEATVKAVKAIDKAAQGEEPERWVKTAIETPGYFIGLPTGQPAVTAQFLWDYQNEEVEPEGIADWYLGLTKGRLPEEDE